MKNFCYKYMSYGNKVYIIYIELTNSYLRISSSRICNMYAILGLWLIH